MRYLKRCFLVPTSVLFSTLIAIAPVIGGEPEIVHDEPLWVGDELIYPEGATIPRYMTELEREFLKRFPHVPSSRALTAPPTLPIHCVAEYEPMEGLLFAWEGGSPFVNSSTDILPTMIKHITTTAAARAYVVVDTSGEQSTATSMLTTAGANMSNVQFVIRTTDSVWIRDYGPRYIYHGQCRGIVDHDYNRPTRPNDDAFPSYFSTVKHHAYYEHQLVHGGGNYHLDALNRSYATELIWNENPGLSHTQIHDIWQDFQNVDTHIFPPFPTSVDSTQHLDMWMQVIADDKVVISDWPNNVGSTQDVICDNAATYMAGQGYTVYRVPARSLSGVHYTYTNVVLLNDVILLPTYTNATIVSAGHNGQALATWQTAMPGKTIIQVNCQAMVGLAGVMHCIVMHVPIHLGGANPTAYLENYRGGEVLTPGADIEINWITDDDVGVVNVDLLLSTDGGVNYDTTIASMTADDGSHLWTVPNICSQQARIKVVARNALDKLGVDASTSNLSISGPSPVGDMDCNCLVELADVPNMVDALVDPDTYGGCDIDLADLNGDTFVDGADLQQFVNTIAP
ncbi:MAG TPA: agmatine deiminase family protein [Phycisphaerae bacterium]|nr:agmatine deiminase family protein [Phycisphaerae bacterium]